MSMRPFCVVLALCLPLAGCDDKQEEVDEFQERLTKLGQSIQERENAAQVCEDLLDQERGRYEELDRQTRMLLPISMQRTEVLDDETLNLLPEPARLDVEDQIRLYQSVVAEKYQVLVEANERLSSQIRSLGHTVKQETQVVREENRSNTEQISSEISAQSERLDGYLAKLHRSAESIERIIIEIQEFNQKEIACSDCWRRSQRKEKKDTILAFNGRILKQLTELHSRSSAD